MNATRSVFAAVANAGLVITVFGVVACVVDAGVTCVVLVTKVAIVGAVPCETTSATALPAAALEPAVGVWLITVPAGTVALGEKVTVPSVNPIAVSDDVAAVCV